MDRAGEDGTRQGSSAARPARHAAGRHVSPPCGAAQAVGPPLSRSTAPRSPAGRSRPSPAATDLVQLDEDELRRRAVEAGSRLQARGGAADAEAARNIAAAGRSCQVRRSSSSRCGEIPTAVTRAMTVRVLFCHGLESGRSVARSSDCARLVAVTAPDMEMSLFNPARRNPSYSLLGRHCLRAFARLAWTRACRPLDACVDVQRAALADGEHDVLLGPSWGAVSRRRSSPRVGAAQRCCCARRSRSLSAAWRAGTIATRLGALDAAQRKRTLIVHGDADDTIPLADSEAPRRPASLLR